MDYQQRGFDDARMKTKEEDALASLIRPIHARDYIVAKGWVKQLTKREKDYYLFGRDDAGLVQIVIPKITEINDYAFCIGEAAKKLAIFEDRPVINILRDMIRPESDCLHFRQSYHRRRKVMTDKIEITDNCWFADIGCGETVLTYVERATDYWSSDSETTVDIDKEMAENIIGWLQDKFDLKTKEDER